MEADSADRRCPIFDPFAAELVASPYAAYDSLLDRDDLAWSPSMRSWVVARMDDVKHVLSDPQFVASDVAGILLELSQRAGRDYRHLVLFLEAVLFFKDGPTHERERRTVAKVVNSVKLSWLETVMRRIADDLVERIGQRDRFDAIKDFAEPLPHLTMGYVLGLPEEDVPVLTGLLAEVTMIFDATSLAHYDRLEIKARDALHLIMSRIEEAVAAGLDNGLRQIFDAAPGEGRERLEQAAATTIFVFRVGAETTLGLLGLMIRFLADQPELLASARADAANVDRIVAEVLRLESNVQRSGRIATADTTIAGTPIRSGDRILVLIGAANRDARCFAQPHAIRLEDARPPDLSFGAGKHFCLGASLARTEARVALKSLMRLPGFARDGEETWYQSRIIRRLTSLPMRIAP